MKIIKPKYADNHICKHCVNKLKISFSNIAEHTEKHKCIINGNEIDYTITHIHCKDFKEIPIKI